jgi:TonB-linked SusC/RagA family outer membrane protein
MKKKLFDFFNLLFHQKKTVYFLFFFQFFLTSAFAQKSITGTVKDEKGEALVGVTVKVKGTNSGTATNSNGNFSITATNDAILEISHTGFLSQEIKTEGKDHIDVLLKPSAATLSDVVVIGYGSQSRQKVTTSVSKLDTKVLENVTYANLGSALQGAIPGVQVQTTTGMPGAAPRIIIRGGTSINNPNGAAPLYIVDGIIRPNMNNLDQSDIESIQVLKDAASTAIYGARGSNGVVIIVTKSGKAGKTQIDYKFDLTVSDNVNYYELLDARDFLYFQRKGYMASAERKPAQLALLGAANSGGTGNDLTNLTAFSNQYLTPENQYKLNEGWLSMPDPYDPTKTIIFSNTDFQSKLYRTGIGQNHSISASGGTRDATFRVGVGYFDQDGIVITSKYKRLNTDLSGDLKLSDKIKVFGRLMYSNSSDNVPGTGANLFGRSQGLPPTAKYKYEDGTLASGVNTSLGNPEYITGYQVAKNSSDNLSIALGGHWDILPGLSFDPQVSLFQITSDSRYFEKAYFNGPKAYNTDRNSSGAFSKLLQKQIDAVLSYTKDFNAHHVDFKGGYSYFGTMSSGLNASGKGAATDLIPTLNAAALPVSVSGTETHQLIFGYFGRINYDYNEKYLLSVNARYDGASNLGLTNKWGFFPGVSVGWNMYKEDFWKIFPDRLFRLKLRASYGVNGNISGLGPYTAQGSYSVGSRYNGVAAVVNTSLANADLKWEQSKTLDFGFDLGILNNRINVLFDIYRRRTDNLLTSLSLPQSTGFGSILTNLGSLENKGIELELNADVFPGNAAFQWNIALNASTVKNKILKLPDNGAENNRIGGYFVWDAAKKDYAWKGGLQEGGTIGDYYAYKQIGVYATDEEAAKAPLDVNVPQTDQTKHGGDVNFLDADGNNIIDSKDMVYVGNIYPKATGGFSNIFSYKNISLIVRMDYTVGQTIFDYTYGTLIGQFQGDNGLSKDLLRSWQKQGDITDIPRFYYADQQASNNIYRAGNGTSLLYKKGDFLALRELTLSYSLGADLLKKIRLSGLRLNVTGNNLHYFTKYTGPNPEDGGRDGGRFPIPRNIIIGLNATF